jgi:DNA-binding protein H-NS
MSVDALVKLRNEIGAVLSSKAAVLKKELAALGEDTPVISRSPGPRKSLTGTKVAPKYRGPGGETWAGRGATPVWMREAIKTGKKREDFLIANGANGKSKKVAKKKR